MSIIIERNVISTVKILQMIAIVRICIYGEIMVEIYLSIFRQEKLRETISRYIEDIQN